MTAQRLSPALWWKCKPLLITGIIGTTGRLHQVPTAKVTGFVDHLGSVAASQFSGIERMAILRLRAMRGWNKAETGRRFLVSDDTLRAWLGRSDDDSLVQTQTPALATSLRPRRWKSGPFRSGFFSGSEPNQVVNPNVPFEQRAREFG